MEILWKYCKVAVDMDLNPSPVICGYLSITSSMSGFGGLRPIFTQDILARVDRLWLI